MPRNKIVGKSKKPGSNLKTGRKYGPSQLASNRRNQKRRVELNREARKRGVYGKRWKKGVDLSHKKGGGVTPEKRSANRRRNGKDGSSTRK